jgi:HlyD family secretion protein
MTEQEHEAEHDDAPGGRRLRVAVAVVGVALLVAAAMWATLRDPKPSDALLLFGNVDVREVDLAFNESDRVVAMYAEEGDAVEAGQLLAELDRSRLEHVVLEAEANAAAQRAIVARLEHGSRPEEIERARAELLAAQAELADAKSTHERLEELARSDAASKQREDDARAAHLSAKARLSAASENLRLAIEGPRSEDIDAARANLRAAENALELARHRLSDTRLHAPAAGTVVTRILEPGAVVLPNSPAYTLALTDPVWARTYISEQDLGRVFPGMKAEITSDSFPDRRYEGWVGFISPTAEFTPKPVETPDLRTSLVYRARIYVRSPDHSLRQGMPVTIRLALDQSPAQAPPSAEVAPLEPPEGATGEPARRTEAADDAPAAEPPPDESTP